MSRPDRLYEVSWEVANMVGGIHTVLASKLRHMQTAYGEGYVAVGPDIPRMSERRPSFAEEAWDPKALRLLEGLEVSCRMGRWLVPGEPRCLLVGYGRLHERKDQILARYWERYRLDSLFGRWDYYDPLLFAHGVGLVVERLTMRRHLPARETVVLHAHEWMSAAAILHLREACPEVGTVFTTHATTLGRAAFGRLRDQGLYDRLDELEPERLARELDVVSKHSMECVAAAQADRFTTVSRVTARECEVFLGQQPDAVLVNALDDDFPRKADLGRSGGPDRLAARRRLLEIAELATGTALPDDRTDIVVCAGRYEYANKGVDLFLDALEALREELAPDGRRLLALLMFPAAHAGSKRGLMEAARGGRPAARPEICTHDLQDEAGDPILTRLRGLGVRNAPEDRLFALSLPIYLDGSDELVPETYLRLLSGADLSVFPSLYEPWGYTPMESIGLGVPTLSSDLAGFGRWAAEQGGPEGTGVRVIPRDGRPYARSVDALRTALRDLRAEDPAARDALREAALRTSRACRWSEAAPAYLAAHAEARERAGRRHTSMPLERFATLARQDAARERPEPAASSDLRAHLRGFVVRSALPTELEGLRELAGNLLWSWRPELRAPLEALDETAWARAEGNAVAFLDALPPSRVRGAAEDAEYRAALEAALRRQRDLLADPRPPDVAYFCMEYGLVSGLPLYAGGLGVLAGDHVKAASDAGLPMVAVGLAYRQGYFRQQVRADGAQEARYLSRDFRASPMLPVRAGSGERLVLRLPFPTGPVAIRAWRVDAGRVPLYLLDTDFEANRPEDRRITQRLYGGDLRTRLRQELVLGVGGVRLLEALGLRPEVYHMNEGHSAFLVLARMARLEREEGLKFQEALDFVQRSTVFTTHTPVAAGHDHFPEEMIRPYLAPFCDALHADERRILGLGQPPDGEGEDFSMTRLALRGSLRANAVSEVHGRVAREMLADVWPGLHASESPLGHVTNGVHVPTWLAAPWQALFDEALGPAWREALADPAYWRALDGLGDDALWSAHRACKLALLSRLRRDGVTGLDEDTLLIGFARRFAPYKRATLIFRERDRLAALLYGEPRAALLFAGKAHPSDGHGAELVREVVALARDPAFRGRVHYLPDYDIGLARRLVSGCDVWLNTPTRPLEASGTSGMKAGINGCLHLSVDDGWWAEAYDGVNGWMLDGPSARASRQRQDASDAAVLLGLLEREVLPLFAAREGGLPRGWVARMRASIRSILPRYSAARMLADYARLGYDPARADAERLAAEGYAALLELGERAARLRRLWSRVTLPEVRIDGIEQGAVPAGRPIRLRARALHPGLRAAELRVEVVIARVPEDGGLDGVSLFDMSCETEGDTLSTEGESHWRAEIVCEDPGAQSLGVRIRPRLERDGFEAAPHSGLVTWY